MSNWWGIAGEAATIIGPLLGKVLSTLGEEETEREVETSYGDVVFKANTSEGTLTATSKHIIPFNLSLHSPSSKAMLNVHIPNSGESINILPYLNILKVAYATIAPAGSDIRDALGGGGKSYYATAFKSTVMAMGTRLMITERISLKRTEEGFELDMPIAPAPQSTAYLSAIYGGAYLKMFGHAFINKDGNYLDGNETGGFKFNMNKNIPDPQAPNVFDDVQLSFDLTNERQYHDVIYNNEKYSLVTSID